MLKNNTFFGNSFYIFAARFFPALANLVVLIVYSRRLTVADLGLYQYFWVQLLVFSAIICGGLHVLLTTYPAEMLAQLWRQTRNKYLYRYLFWALAASSLFALLQLQRIPIALAVPFFFVFLYATAAVLESVLVVQRRFSLLVTANVLFSAAWVAVHFVILRHGFDFKVLYPYLLALVACRFGVYGAACFPQLSRVVGGTPVADLRKVGGLWFHLGLFDVIQILSGYLDKFVISLLLSTSLSAYYNVGSQNIPFLPILLSAAGSAVLLKLADNAASPNSGNEVALMNQSGRLLSAIVFPVFFFCLFFCRELITVVFSMKYLPAVPVFFASLFVLPLRAYSFTTLLQKHHKGRIINIGAVSELAVACGLMYPLFRMAGLPGVALSFVISTWLQAAFYLYHTGKVLGVQPLALIPLRDWARKGALYLVVLGGWYWVLTYFTGPKITLILGAAGAVAVAGMAVVAEIKRQSKNGRII